MEPSPKLEATVEPLKIFKLYSPSNNLTSFEITTDFVIEDQVYSIAKCESRSDTLYIYYKDKVDEGFTQLTCGEHSQMQRQHVPIEAPLKQINAQQMKDYLVEKEDFRHLPNVAAILEINTDYCLLFKSFSPKVLIPPPKEA